MYCDQCGTQNRDQAKFCVKCGARISEPETNNTSDSSTYETIKSTNSMVSPQIQYHETNSLSQYTLPEQSAPCLRSVGDYISQKEEIESRKAKQENLTLWQVIKSLNKLDGRITRSTSWKIIATYISVLICFYIIYYILQSTGLWSDIIEALCILVAVPTIAYIYVTTFTTLLVQRLHDIGLSGWYWWLLPIVGGLAKNKEYKTDHLGNVILPELSGYDNFVATIALALLVAILVVYFIPGNEEPNDYGFTRK